jgi:phosphopantetheine adenylyltransferase
MVLPLAFEESSFDYYDSDEHIYIITEKEVQNCLMSKKDDFINRKIILEEDLKVKNYRDYFVIGYFNIYNDIITYLYYRTIQPINCFVFFELVLVTKKNNEVIDYLVISEESEKKSSYSNIKYDNNGIVNIELICNYVNLEKKDQRGGSVVEIEKKNKELYQIQPNGHIIKLKYE